MRLPRITDPRDAVPGWGCRYRLDCQVPSPPAARTTCPQRAFSRARSRHPLASSRGVVDSSRRARLRRPLIPAPLRCSYTSDQTVALISAPHTQSVAACASPRQSPLSDITRAPSSAHTTLAPVDYAVWLQSPESTRPPAPPHYPLSTAAYVAGHCCPSDTGAGSVQHRPPPLAHLRTAASRRAPPAAVWPCVRQSL